MHFKALFGNFIYAFFSTFLYTIERQFYPKLADY